METATTAVIIIQTTIPRHAAARQQAAATVAVTVAVEVLLQEESSKLKRQRFINFYNIVPITGLVPAIALPFPDDQIIKNRLPS